MLCSTETQPGAALRLPISFVFFFFLFSFFPFSFLSSLPLTYLPSFTEGHKNVLAQRSEARLLKSRRVQGTLPLRALWENRPCLSSFRSLGAYLVGSSILLVRPCHCLSMFWFLKPQDVLGSSWIFPAQAFKCDQRVLVPLIWAHLREIVPFAREHTLAVLIDPGLLFLVLFSRQSYEIDVCIYTWNYLYICLSGYVFSYLNLYLCLQFHSSPIRLILAFPLSWFPTPFSDKQQPSSHFP